MFIFIPKVGTRLEVLSLPRNSPRTEFTASLHCVYFRMTHNWEWTRRACADRVRLTAVWCPGEATEVREASFSLLLRLTVGRAS